MAAAQPSFLSRVGSALTDPSNLVSLLGAVGGAAASRDSTTSIRQMPIAIARGGVVLALGTRWMCTHINSRVSSGAPMCTNASSEKKRSSTLSAYMKLRTRLPPMPGSQSSHSKLATVTNCASRSHGSM